MIRWERADGRFVGLGRPQLIRWLRGGLLGLAGLIDQRMAEYSTDYPLGDRLGLPLPEELPADPVLATLLRAELLDPEEPPEIQLWREPDFLRQLRANLTAALDTLDEEQGVITLAEDAASVRGWSSVLLSLRIAHAAAWAPELLTTGELPDPPAGRRKVYRQAAWLWDVVNTLHALAVS